MDRQEWTNRIMSARSYDAFMNVLSEEEQRQYGQLKRFSECVQGDPDFRKAFDANSEDPSAHEHLRSIGVEIDVREFGLFNGDMANHLLWHMIDVDRNPDDDVELSRLLDQAPLVNFWLTCSRRKAKLSRDTAELAPRFPELPRMQAWQRRRMAAAKSELGRFSQAISYPLFAYELSKGCSVRCWFCGFSAQKLSAVFDRTPENREFWLEILQAGIDIFGRPAASRALCYYATEPNDNPAYLDYIQDFEKVNGAAVCTATAVPLKDTERFRQLVRYYRKRLLPWPRVSVLSTAMLRRIHRTYSPDELRDVELLMQMRTAPRAKALSGRTLGHELSDLGGFATPDGQEVLPQGSIACVTGFLLNMVERTVELISPCMASDCWPHGYRVFARDRFDNAADYRAILHHMIEEFMPEQVGPDMILRFRDDLCYEPLADGFDLRSRYHLQHVRGGHFHPLLGELIAAGRHTYSQVLEQIAASGNLPLFAANTIGDLFNRGMLDEVAPRLNS